MRREAKDLGHMRAKEERAGLVSKDMLSAVVEGQKAKVAHLRTPSHTFSHLLTPGGEVCVSEVANARVQLVTIRAGARISSVA